MHIKRQQIPRKWPVPRKGTTFVVRSLSNRKEGIPMLVVLRDMLKVAQNKREVRRAIHYKNVMLNGKKPSDEKNSVSLFDVVTLVPSKKSYKLSVGANGKFTMDEVSESESGKKIAKIIGKKLVKGGKTQINMLDGSNFIADIKCNSNDSAVIDLKNRKVEKCIPLKEKAKALVFEGKHAGEMGTVQKIDDKHKMVELKTEDRTFNALIKQMIVIE